MTMSQIQISEEIEKRLTALAARTGRSESWHVHRAVLDYLDDMEDGFLAESRVGEERVSLEEVERRLGLA